jgi:chromosome segregation ATPase
MTRPEDITCDEFAAKLADKPPIYLTPQPDPRDAEIERLNTLVAGLQRGQLDCQAAANAADAECERLRRSSRTAAATTANIKTNLRAVERNCADERREREAMAVDLATAREQCSKLRAVIARVQAVADNWADIGNPVWSHAASSVRKALGEYATTADAGLLESARSGR